MNILEKVQDSFNDCESGTEFSCREIIDKVVQKHGCNPESIIPSDYCYNRINNGINFQNYLHIFEYLSNSKYKYLGTNYPYNGTIYHKPKGGIEVALGEWVNGNIKINSNVHNQQIERITELDKQQSSTFHKTRREVSLTMRFQVMKRDNFRCCICGASPAKDPSIELHIDHIIPWSKGGETELDNLQTLCSKCNLGKGDILL